MGDSPALSPHTSLPLGFPYIPPLWTRLLQGAAVCLERVICLLIVGDQYGTWKSSLFFSCLCSNALKQRPMYVVIQLWKFQPLCGQGVEAKLKIVSLISKATCKQKYPIPSQAPSFRPVLGASGVREERGRDPVSWAGPWGRPESWCCFPHSFMLSYFFPQLIIHKCLNILLLFLK